MAKQFVRENVPLSRFGVLVAQLESIVASASHKLPDPLLCFDLLSDLLSAIDEEPKDSILLWQRKCEDALYSLLVLGARRPVRHLASVAMAKIILKGDSISIYSRVSSLQGFLSDGKRSEPQRVAGAAQCLGELYRCFGRRITAGLLETTGIVTKLLKFNEDFVRQEALYMLKNALEGSGGNAAVSAYVEAFRIIMRVSVGDKSFLVRKAVARCLKAFANIGGPGLGVGDIENSSSYCVKALEDPISSVRDAFAEALGMLLALGISPDAQFQTKAQGHLNSKKLEGGLQRHLSIPFIKASGPRKKDLCVGLTLSWVSFLQAVHLRYSYAESELQNFALQVMDMLRGDNSVDAQALACVLYILHVGVTDQMSEPAQRDFLVFLGNQLQSSDATPSMRIAALRTLSYTLKTLGEVPKDFKEVLDNTVVAALSHYSPLVRVEAALTLRTLAEVDPSCVGGLISYAVTMLGAVRENIYFEKGTNLKLELESLHGEASVLAALVSISPRLPLGYPSGLPRSILDVSKKMLMESSRNPMAAIAEKEAGWTLLSSLLASMPKEELEDQVFDILSLWASLFNENPRSNQTEDLSPSICVWSAAIEALTAFIKCFVSADGVSKGILLQPVLLYLSRGLSHISVVAGKDQSNAKAAMDVFILRTLVAYQSISDPNSFKSDHDRLIQICTIPFRDASRCEESSCLRMLLDKRDAWLGPWTPGRDWFEDELRSFQGGKDGILPCLWENEHLSFPLPETVSKMLVNQMLLCFGTLFASQGSGGMLSLLGLIEQCLKAGRKQAFHTASVTNICVGLLSGLKALVALRPEPLGSDILSAAQSIFQSILAEGDICASQRRAASEGLGLLARLGDDIFAARLTKLLLGDAYVVTDLHYAGSIALALGSIHLSAGGIALSTLVPATVNSLSCLAKSSLTSLQIWSLHGLLLTTEAAGLSYVSHVQATLALAMDILLSEESGRVDLQQGLGRLINAIIAVVGPDLAPDSIFFTRCKSVLAEISSNQETATLIENVRFTQQLVLFAPQAVPVHSHVQTLLPTLSSRQPTLRHLALSTLRHLVEMDPVPIIDEQIEEALFHMLDQETDIEIAIIARTTIIRLLYASCPSRPSHWLSVCHNMILSSSRREGGNNSNISSSSSLNRESRSDLGEDDENMVTTAKSTPNYSRVADKHLRYRTRVFAAECLSHLPGAVGKNPAHFDLSVARAKSISKATSGDWLVVQLQELVSLAYQISTIQFDHMRPIGVVLLSAILDKFEMIADPELPGHLLLEQYQAQLLSAVRTALDPLSGPMLLEGGLQLATKILTSGVIRQDQAAVKRIFSLISRPLNDFNDLYYPSFAEWVSCKIKVRLLAAHASLKCYAYGFLSGEGNIIPDECQSLLPLFSKNSDILGTYWLAVLKDFCHIRFGSHPEGNWKPFLDGVQSSLVSSKLLPCFEEAWPVILQAMALDASPAGFVVNGSETNDRSESPFISKCRMVELKPEEFHFLWGFSLLVLFQGQYTTSDELIIPLYSVKSKFSGDWPVEDANLLSAKVFEVILPVMKSMSVERFFSVGFLSADICQEFLLVSSYSIFVDSKWDSHAVSVLLKILQECPKDFLVAENFAYLASEICLAFLFKICVSSAGTFSYNSSWETVISVSLNMAVMLIRRTVCKMQLKLFLAFLLMGYKLIGGASNVLCLTRANDFLQSIISLIRGHIDAETELVNDAICQLRTIIQACLRASASLSNDCMEKIHQLADKRSNLHKLLLMKLAYSLEHIALFTKLAFEIEHPVEEQEAIPTLSAVLRYSNQCVLAVLQDHDVQVQATGLRVIKNMLQKGSSASAMSNSFEIYFVGELVGSILTMIHEYLQTPLNRESLSVIGECLKILMLLQVVSKASECQKYLLNVLLEALFMVFSASENRLSQEINELRSMAVKLVTQLAQSPLSASHFKDVLLLMPISRRQQLQDIIRASVTQDQSSGQKLSAVSPLVIKMPSQMDKSKENNSFPSSPTRGFSDGIAKEDFDGTNDDNDDDEDDWDTFQSFPANLNDDPSTSYTSAEGPTLYESSSVSEHKAEISEIEVQSSSQSSAEATETTGANDVVAGAGLMFGTEEDRNQVNENNDLHNSCQDTEHLTGNVKESNGVVPDLTDMQTLTVQIEAAVKNDESHDVEEIRTETNSENKHTLQTVQHADNSDSYHEKCDSPAAGSCHESEQGSSDAQPDDYSEPLDSHHPENETDIRIESAHSPESDSVIHDQAFTELTEQLDARGSESDRAIHDRSSADLIVQLDARGLESDRVIHDLASTDSTNDV